MKIMKLKENRKISFVKIVAMCVILLAAVCLFSGGIQKVNAKSVPDHLYALSVSTGVANGESIGFFAVEYKDTNGKIHTERIFPHDGDYVESCELVKEYGVDTTAIENAEAHGYSLPGSDLDSARGKKALDINSENVYFMQLEHDVKSVESITIYTDYAATVTKNWTCTGLRFYKVTAIDGYKYYSGIADKAYVDFAGTLMARMKKDHQEFNSANDTAFVLDAKSTKYPLQTSGFDEADRELSEESYIFKLDIADSYGAGIETFTNIEKKASLASMKLPETANLTVTYKDIFNTSRTIEIPVITNALSYAYEQLGQDIAAAHFVGQGDSIVFSANMPHFAELVGVKFSYGPDYVKELTGMQDTMDFMTRDALIRKIKDTNDTMGLVGLSIYNEEEANVSLILENSAAIVPSIDESAKPLYFYRAPKADGLRVAMDKSSTLDMKEYEKGDELSHVDSSQKYLIVIDTDSNGTSASLSNIPNIEMKLSYTATDGSARESEAYNLEELAKQYYGYVPGISFEDCGYLMNVTAGGQLKVLVSLEGVETFNGATFTLTDLQDEWQMSGISIYMVDSVSNRKAFWLEESLHCFGQEVRVKYDRNMDGSDELNPAKQLLSMSEKVFLHNGESKTLGFDSMSVTETIQRIDWTKDYYYSMDYETASSDLGFYMSDIYYQVAVKVADNSSVNADDGDSGSQNFFYFQLLFENGKESAVVQANQQLESDGFLTGSIATFNIAANRDYGELQAIRIIPDDVSEDADPYDKLNIENITVTKRAGSGYSTVWTIDHVGWIGPEYKDDGEKNASEDESKGRTMEEMAKTFAVTSIESNVQIQFAITTGNYGKPDGSLMNQFVGSISAEISYIDNNGVYQTTNGIDVVEYMYYYAEKNPGAKSSSGLRISDKGFMFRENSTDRFTIHLNNVKKIVDMRLYVSSDAASVLNIAGVSCSLVTKEGYVGVNKWGEYERDSEIIPLTSNAELIPPFEVAAHGTTEFVVDFIDTDENMIAGLLDGTWPHKVTSESISKYDYINAFVYPQDPTDVDKDIQLQLSVTYADAYGKSYNVVRNLKPQETDEGYYYSVLKLGTARLNAIKEVKILKVNGVEDEKIDHVIIQRVRGGSILQTERYEFNGKLASAEPTGIYAGMVQGSLDSQVVHLAFSEGMARAELNKETKDVAVAIRYTSHNDPSGAEYLSPYVYLTSEGFREVVGGNSAKLNFNISDVDEIKGIVIAATGGLSVDVSKAYVATYEGKEIEVEQPVSTDTNTNQQTETTKTYEKELTGWYSILLNTRVSNTSKEFGITTNEIHTKSTVIPVRLFLKTGTEFGQNAGTDGAIAMTMTYVGYDGVVYTKRFADLNPYVVSGNFNSGKEAEVVILEENVKEIYSFTFEPYSEDSAETSKMSWKLDEVSAHYGIDLEEYTKNATVSVGTFIYEGEPRTVSMKNVIIELAYLDGNTYIPVNRTTSSGLIRNEGEEVVFKYQLYNSVEGVQVRAYEVIGSAKRDVTNNTVSQRYSSNGSGEYVFLVPPYGEEKEYLIEVRAVENTDVASSFIVVSDGTGSEPTVLGTE